MTQPWSTIAEHEETGALSYELHIPFGGGNGAFVVIWDEASVREIHAQLEEFLTLVEQKQAVEAIISMDSGGH